MRGKVECTMTATKREVESANANKKKKKLSIDLRERKSDRVWHYPLRAFQ